MTTDVLLHDLKHDGDWLLHRKIDALRCALALNKGDDIPRGPLVAFLEVSNLCNYKCAFCGSFSAINPHRFAMLKQTERGFLDIDQLGDGIEDLLSGCLAVYLFGYGEPTIHPQFQKFLEYASAFRTQIEFVTNGLELTDELAKTLVNNSVYKINISFSGATKSDYENFYLNGDFERVVGNLRNLAEVKRQANSKYPLISINSIAFKHHIARLPEFVDLMSECGANIICVHALTVFSAFPELFYHAEVFRPDKHDALLREARRRAELAGVILATDAFERQVAHSDEDEGRIRLSRVSGNVPDADKIPYIPVNGISEYARTVRPERAPASPPTKLKAISTTEEALLALNIGAATGPEEPFYCFEPFRTAYIRRDGNVKPCCLWPESDFYFGNVHKDTASEIWNGPVYSVTRGAILSGTYPDNCHYCVKSRVAPQDPQLGIIFSYAEWYKDCYGENLLETLNVANLRPAAHITSNLLANAPEGVSIVEKFVSEHLGWDERLAHIRQRLSSNAPTVVIGYIDWASADGIAGWVWSPEQPDVHFRVEVVANGRTIGAAVAMVRRLDLVQNEIGSGNYGFILPPDESLNGPLDLQFTINEIGYTSPVFHFDGA